MKTDFFPPVPAVLGDSIMERIHGEFAEIVPECQDFSPEFLDASVDTDDSFDTISLRGWVITGIVVLISLVTTCFSIDFSGEALSQNSSFLLAVWITFGAVITGYGAFFIGSHLKEFSSRFRLH
jgi:hypothetical protein